jgi:hypothetical protein
MFARLVYLEKLPDRAYSKALIMESSCPGKVGRHKASRCNIDS